MANENKIKVKPSVIVRIIVLAFALVNQCLAIFGKGLPFTSDVVYQVLTFIVTVVAVLWAWWKNNDITGKAKLSGKLFQALKDGKITADEANDLLNSADEILVAEEEETEADE